MSLGCMVRAAVMAAVLFVGVVDCPAATLGRSGDGVSDFIYNPFDGEILVDPDGATIGAFQLVSASGIFTGADATLPPGLFTSDTDTEIGVGALNQPTLDLFTLGQVAQADLSLNFLLGDLTTARGSAGLGSDNREFGVFGLFIMPFPEPSSCTLALLGALGLMVRRKRLNRS